MTRKFKEQTKKSKKTMVARKYMKIKNPILIPPKVTVDVEGMKFFDTLAYMRVKKYWTII